MQGGSGRRVGVGGGRPHLGLPLPCPSHAVFPLCLRGRRIPAHFTWKDWNPGEAEVRQSRRSDARALAPSSCIPWTHPCRVSAQPGSASEPSRSSAPRTVRSPIRLCVH